MKKPKYDTGYTLRKIPLGTKKKVYNLRGLRQFENFVIEAIVEKLERMKK